MNIDNQTLSHQTSYRLASHHSLLFNHYNLGTQKLVITCLTLFNQDKITGNKRLVNFYKKVKDLGITSHGLRRITKRVKLWFSKDRLIFLLPLGFSLQKVGSPANRRSSTQLALQGTLLISSSPKMVKWLWTLWCSLITLLKVYAHSTKRRDPDILLLPSHIPARLGTKALIITLNNPINRESFFGLHLSLSLVTSFLGLVAMLNLSFIKPIRPNIFRKKKETH